MNQSTGVGLVFDTTANIDHLVDHPSPQIFSAPKGHAGYTPELKAKDTPQALRDAAGDTNRAFPAKLWIDVKDRIAKAAENDKRRRWGINYLDRFTNQGSGGGGYSTHECTTHGLRCGYEAARNKQRSIIYADGPKVGERYEVSKKGSVWVSPLSIYAEANPGQWGGAGCIQVLNIACKRGFLPDKIQPADYKFKHSLHGTCGKGGVNQSRGAWTSVANFPEGWRETAALLMPAEVVVTTDWEEALCLMLHGYVVNYGRNGHAVAQALFNMTSMASGYPDSYDVVRWDSFGTFKSAVSGGCYAIISVKTPDDWNNPAGIAV